MNLRCQRSGCSLTFVDMLTRFVTAEERESLKKFRVEILVRVFSRQYVSSEGLTEFPPPTPCGIISKRIDSCRPDVSLWHIPTYHLSPHPTYPFTENER